MRYQFDLGRTQDDAALRQVMAQTTMAGSVTLSFHREPSYFDSNRILGNSRQTIVCRDTVRGEIVGLATRSVRNLYVDGQVQPVGYLGALRSVEHARNRGQLARGYQFLKELHDADPNAPDFYLTTIAEENQQAIELLTSGRVGLPTYHPLSRLHTLVLPIQRNGNDSRFKAPDNCEVSHLNDPEELINFLNTVGSKKTFFPAYQLADYQQPQGIFHGLEESSIVTVRRKGQIVAAAGLWDQRTFRQTIVSGYPWWVHVLRPALNVWAHLTNGILLPGPGDPLRACFICFPVVAHGEESVLPLLLPQLMQIAPDDAQCLLFGLCDDDPLLPIARSHSRLQYTTRLYAVNWATLPESIVAPGARPYYLELGTL